MRRDTVTKVGAKEMVSYVDKRLRVGFMMDQIAGHVTNYRNLRRYVDADTSIDPVWWEVNFFDPNGKIERAAKKLRKVPTYVTGVSRGSIELRHGLTSADFDVIYCNSSVAVFFARRLGRTPTLLDFDSTPVQIDRMESYMSPKDPAPVALLKDKMNRRLFHAVHTVQTWSSWARQSFIDDYGVPSDRVVINPPGVDLELWERSGEPRPSDGSVRVLFVGGDFVRKGGNLLVEWFKQLPPGQVRLDLVTREPVDPHPGLFVHANLTPNSAELLRLYHDADLFVLPSLAECFGIATVEAMAAGLPVVASDSGGTADIIAEGENGHIVAAGDQRALNAALDSLVASPERRLAMGRASRQRAEELFDLRITSRRTIERLQSLSAGGR